MFGLNKKLKQNTTSSTSKVEKKSEEKKLPSNANSTQLSKKAIPDLICKSFADGCLVLGCIHDISSSELIVSLPGIGNYGHVKLNNISEIYSNLLKKENKNDESEEGQVRTLVEMFNKGDLVRCKVLNFSDRKLFLTIEPSQVNSNLNYDHLEDEMIITGSVKTKEDHGYTIDLGIGDLSGFYRLPKDSTHVLSIGQTCLFKVISKTSKRVINLKLCSSEESIFYNLKTRNQFDTYLPGSHLANCTIEKVSKNGLQLSLPNDLFAYVHSNHIPINKRSKKLSEIFTSGEKLTGTIIFINPYSKIIYLSVLPHLIDSRKHSKISGMFASHNEDCLRLGQIVENAQVSMHTFKGIYVRFDGPESKQVQGFIPKRHLIDENDNSKDENSDEEEEVEEGEKLKKEKKDANNMDLEDIEKLFPLNTTLKARIFDFNLIEDMILLSSRPKVINALFMNYEELSVSQTLKCRVKSINAKNGGVSVEISDFLNGFIPKIHTSDIPLSEALVNKKLKIGSEVKCKVIQINASEKRCILTAKKSLVKSKYVLVDSYDQLYVGMETYGVVVSIKDYGLLLSFLGEIKGILPRQEISKSITKEQDLNELYYLGQLIKCNVKQFSKEKNTLKLSLLMDETKNQQITHNPNNNTRIEINYKPGEMIESAIILQVNDENQYFRIKLPRGNKHGMIYKNHLSDFAPVNDLLFEYYRHQMKLANLLVIHDSQLSGEDKKLDDVKVSKSSCYYLTLKTTLISFYGNNEMPKTLTDLEPNKWYHGWIRNVIKSGVLVEIPTNCVGFCSNLKISNIDQLKSSNVNGLTVGQSVLIKVNKLFDLSNGNANDNAKRFLTSIRTGYDLSQKNENDQKFMIEVFGSFLQSINKVNDLFASSTKANAQIGIMNKNMTQSLLEKIGGNDKLKAGNVVKVVVKSFNKHSGQIECLFLNDLDDSVDLNSNLNLTGYAFAIASEEFRQGSKLDALILAFDPLTKTFCLSVDKKVIKVYRKNFDETFKKQVICQPDQTIKAEVVFVAQWFCIIGLKAHALGRLALMPFFKNDFTQLNRYMSTHDYLKKPNSSSLTKLDLIDLKVKQNQLLAVSAASLEALSFNSITEDLNEKLKKEAQQEKSNSKIETKKQIKEEKRFGYFYVGQSLNVLVKTSDNLISDEYLMVFNDLNKTKRNKKQLLRQLAILNENHLDNDENGVNGNTGKRKRAANDDEDILIKKKLVLSGEKKKRKLSLNENEDTEGRDCIEVVANVKKSKITSNEAVSPVENGKDAEMMFPWEVTDFDQFYDIVNKVTSKELDNKQNEVGGKKKEKGKNKVVRVDDRTIFEKEEQVFDATREPENSDDYERILASKPSNSLLWIKYMVFYLQMAEIDKARSVANKALQTIVFNEEAERLNVWVALLNLENMYGTPESIEKTMNKATQNCDSLKIHFHMAEIFARAGKQNEAETIFVKMTKKFNRNPEVWIKYGIFQYKNSNSELARKLLLKSFNSLDKQDHIDMVNKFAQLEFKYGELERAKTMYDSLLFTYPNRTDIWSVYIDMLVKHEKFEDARQIFNRIIQMGLTVKRMKFIFKKYLDFEKAYGNDESVEKMKDMAGSYVEKKSKSAENNGHESSIQENLKKNLKI